MARTSHRFAKRLIPACLLVLIAGQIGCVRRRMTIRSNPAGAVVYVDNRRIGVTPVSTSFTYYGTRRIQLIKDGFETVTEDHKFNAPWYQWPGIDFFAENFWPVETRDERILEFQLTPQQSIPPAKVLERAEQLRGSAQQGLLTPQPPPRKHPLHGGRAHARLQGVHQHLKGLQNDLRGRMLPNPSPPQGAF